MDISFREPRLRDLLSMRDRMETEFGPPLARLIRCRLSMLRAARSLDLLPTRPPVSLSRVHGSGERYSVALGSRHQLRFDAGSRERQDTPEAKVTCIDVVGVVPSPAGEERAR